MKKKPGGTFSTLELCAGGGGTALGLEEAGFSPVALLDNDHEPCGSRCVLSEFVISIYREISQW
jgi:site-specific DNA-cytosine methylase